MLIEDANQNNFSAFCIHLISRLSNNWNWLRFINGSGLLTSIGGLYSSKVGFVRRCSALFGDYRYTRSISAIVLRDFVENTFRPDNDLDELKLLFVCF